MATSIYIISESSDHYHYLEEKDMNTEEIIEYLKEHLDEEFAYIGQMSIQTTKEEINNEKIWDVIYGS